MSSDPITPQVSRVEYESLREQGLLLVDRGDFEGALVAFERAHRLAVADGDPRLVDQARCSLASVEVELGRPGAAPALAQILLRSRDAENSFFAAYNLARAHELKKDHQKALFYAQKAQGYARRLGADRRAMSHNQLGNLLLTESWFKEAAREYSRALALLPAHATVKRALVLDNLGYSHVVRGRRKDGFRALFQSLRALRRAGARRYEMYTRLSLCYGYLEAGRVDRALEHGYEVLQLADEFGDRESTKNALFLLGEAQKQAGDETAARVHFDELQRSFYPAEGYLSDLLLTVDVRQMVNLKA